MPDLLLNDNGSFALDASGAFRLLNDLGECDECCEIECLECVNCEPCDKLTESPGCPPDCCTPRTLRVVLSGFNASVCTNCYNCTGTVGPGGSSAQFLALRFDGTFCFPFDSGCTVLKKFPPGSIDVKCFESTPLGFCDLGGAVCLLDHEILIDRLAGAWRVRMFIRQTLICGENCSDICCGLWFDQTIAVAKCNTAFVVTNTTSCVCLSSPLSVIGNPASAGTITITPCFGPGLCP